MEKRKHRRSLLRLDVELVYPDGERCVAKSRDLSIGGIYIEATNAQARVVGMPVTVIFLSIPFENGFYSIKAKVQRLTEDGVILIFVDFGLNDLHQINAIMLSSS